MTGLTLEEARRVAIERGWNVDGTMVQPCKIQKEESNLVNEVCLTEDQLYKLTQFVSFLENWTSNENHQWWNSRNTKTRSTVL